METIVLKSSWIKAIKNLPKENSEEAYKVICDYAYDGTEPDSMSTLVEAIFLILKEEIDEMRMKRIESSRKRREAGAKGGRQKAINARKDLAKSSNAKMISSESKDDKTTISEAKETTTKMSSLRETKPCQASLSQPKPGLAMLSNARNDSENVSLLSPTPPIISSITINSNQDLNKKETLSKERAKKKENSGTKLSRIEEFEDLCDEFMDSLEDCPMKDVFQEWLSFRLSIRKPYKTMQAIRKCYQHLCDISYNDPDLALEIVDHSVASEYIGLYPLPQRTQRQQYPQRSQYELYHQNKNNPIAK